MSYCNAVGLCTNGKAKMRDGRYEHSIVVGFLFLPFASSFVLSSGGFRWTVPEAISSSSGLGGGLSYVVDENFCADMLGRFPERDLIDGYEISALQFVHCADLRNALQRGFATWADNHRLISFTDVATTTACVPSSSRTGVLLDACPWELYVGTDDGTTYGGLAAYVMNHRTSALNPTGWHRTGVRSASGEHSSSGDAHARSVMRFQNHLCWYLDATFCYYFQVWQDVHNLDVLLIVRLILASVFGLAVLRLAAIVFWAFVACSVGKRELPLSPDASARKPNCCAAACTACLNYLSSLSPAANILLIFCLTFPPIFYERIFLPCWECYDFESVIAHETGHVLGFGHPDEAPDENLVASCPVTNATCRTSFASCSQLAPYDEGSNGGTAGTERSIMHSVTFRSSRTCLSAGDLGGLHLLYPLCDGSQPSAVSCTKGRILSGWLRLAIVVGVPFLFAILAVLLPLTLLRWRDQRRMRRLDKELGHARNEVLEYRAKLTEAMSLAVKERARAALHRPATAMAHSASTPGTALNRISRAAEAAQLGSGRLFQRAWPVAPEPIARNDSYTLQAVTADGECMARVLPPALLPPLKKARSRPKASESPQRAREPQQPLPSLTYILKTERAPDKQWAESSHSREAEARRLKREADAWRLGPSAAQGTDV